MFACGAMALVIRNVRLWRDGSGYPRHDEWTAITAPAATRTHHVAGPNLAVNMRSDPVQEVITLVIKATYTYGGAWPRLGIR